MEIELRTIDDGNRAAVAALTVSDSQKQFIATNKRSLETAAQEENREIARPFAICADGELVGFAMFAFELDSPDPDDRYWLWRFMIDQNFQGRGYGSAALEKIIGYFRNQGADHILLSTEENNTRALSLYHKYGFRKTGAMNDDEIVLLLKL